MSSSVSIHKDDYPGASRRLYQDANHLYSQSRFATATHLFGLAAECAIKTFLDNIPGGDRQIPKKHIPELLDDAKLWLQGRQRSHLLNVISHPDYMHGWMIHNRYWPDTGFNKDDCERFRHDAYRTLSSLPDAI